MDYNEVAKGYEEFNDFTEWELGYKKVLKLLGNVKNKVTLDYGAGNLKFSRVLRDKEAKCIAVEPSKEMLKISEKYDNNNIEIYNLEDNDISFLKSASVDIVVINFVICVISKKEEIEHIIKETYRVLKKGGLLIILDPNPKSIGGNFLSFKSEKPSLLKSGTPYKVRLKINSEEFVNLIDYYWSLDDYKNIIKIVGFKDIKIEEPIISKDNKDKEWIEEKIKAPYVIIKTFK